MSIRPAAPAMPVDIELPGQVGPNDPIWVYKCGETSIPVRPPVLEINGDKVVLSAALRQGETRQVSENLADHLYNGTVTGRPGLSLHLLVRIARDSPIIRFQYEVKSNQSHRLTKSNGEETSILVGLDITEDATEVRLSDYTAFGHTYKPTEVAITGSDFDRGRSLMGPLLVWSIGTGNALLAYEHGSQYPDSYLAFTPSRTAHGTAVALGGTKGTYLHGTDLQHGFRSVWLHLGATSGARAKLERSYRDFIHYSQSVAPASRQPYIFYNTWNHQERLHFWEEKSYLTDMTEQRMLAEIEVAHKLGVEVFVLDTGWYDATGDWRVSAQRFPNGLDPLKKKLDEYGMKLGLWFGPTTASLSSATYKRNVKNKVSWKGVLAPTRKIWETEESAEFCLVSSYADDFAEELIRCAKEWGVTYFKWDAIDQYGCDSPDHQHGDASHSQQDRADRYAFCQPLAMVDIVEKLCAAIPEAIVDFDVTEYDRCFGLAFLSVGKYFLINNGPYIHNFDVPRTKDYSFRNNSLFFHPGPARDWVCRTPYSFDTWLPSVLFLVHYLPDDPVTNQNMTAASLVLGHNGIWGDLLGIKSSGVDHLAKLLAPYKDIRHDAASVAAFRTGGVGDMIETYEKISTTTGKGLVAIFGNVTMQGAWGKALTMRQPLVGEIATEAKVSQTVWHTPNVQVTFDDDGRALLKATFHTSDAALVYFGVS